MSLFIFSGTMRDSALLSPSATRTPVQQQPIGMCLPGHYLKNFLF